MKEYIPNKYLLVRATEENTPQSTVKLLEMFAAWLEYNGKGKLPKDQVYQKQEALSNE
jgi:hypothetical protein